MTTRHVHIFKANFKGLQMPEPRHDAMVPLKLRIPEAEESAIRFIEVSAWPHPHPHTSVAHLHLFFLYGRVS